MELVIELRGLQSPGWFEGLTGKMRANPDLANVHLSETRPAPGTFGASRKAKVKAHLSAKDVLSTAAELALGLGKSEKRRDSTHGIRENRCDRPSVRRLV
jgi:hypothetical protein